MHSRVVGCSPAGGGQKQTEGVNLVSEGVSEGVRNRRRGLIWCRRGCRRGSETDGGAQFGVGGGVGGGQKQTETVNLVPKVHRACAQYKATKQELLKPVHY
eukprot:1195138-Prorocentrum_minimum.AAC.2